MLKLLITTLILSSFSTKNELDIGKVLPLQNYKMKDISGTEFILKDLKKENGLLLIFSCNTCPWVIKWQDRYPTIAKLAEKNDIGFTLVNSNEKYRDGDDSYDEMKRHAKENNYNCKYMVDKNNKLADALGANRTPHVFLFDTELKLVYRGAIDDNASDKEKVKNKYLINAMNELAENKDIKIKKTKSLGCSIKRI